MSGTKKGKRRDIQPIAKGRYQPVEDFLLCKAQDCQNVIARWARGSGYCVRCRKKRL